MSESLNDRAISALVAVKSIDVSNDHPMRHAVRTIRDSAQNCLGNAFAQAERLAWTARDLVTEFDRHQAEKKQEGGDA
jgi:hypothetical protein